MNHPIDINFQLPASPIAEGIFSFHNDLIIFLLGILVFVRYILFICLQHFTQEESIVEGASPKTTHKLIHASTLEIVWTIIPALVLVVIAIPSFSLLYSIDEIVQPVITLKAVGHQWYWSYEYVASTGPRFTQNQATTVEFDMYILSDDEVNLQCDNLQKELKELISNNDLSAFSDNLEEGISFNEELIYPSRLLTVDNHLVLPINMPISVRVTSTDVLHSWAIPSLGVKLDACPGRLNQTSIFIKRSGVYYGQCSEICGVNHGFMPIGIIGMNEIVLSPSDRILFDMECVNQFIYL